ncbi:molybdenum cofactor guanylyltransferase MobA [Pseudomonas sp. KB-10]|uniref:molybdenum cofactor guanylyltransferase MobA n=1 Tax=Pseudomonas sp. KB-10 TaxID=2292264 RepID=UPI002010E69F|nr:molybdenum cofactor guanylyltransferase MobA [Pseudomonas sp. KB-10]
MQDVHWQPPVLNGFEEVPMREWFTGLVLSGGQGSRLGGVDKGLVPWCGRPMAEWVVRQMRPLVGELIISCNRNVTRYAALCDRALSDDQAGYPGPLAGILAGLRSMRGTHLLVAPCDLPAVESELLEELQQLALARPGQIAVVRQGERLQPLLCVLPRTLLVDIDRAWVTGERSPCRLWQRLGICELACREDDPRLLNFNCPEVLLVARQSPQREWKIYVDHR